MKKKFLCLVSLLMTPILFLILITAVCLIKLPDKIYTKNDETVPSIAPIGNTITKVDDDSNKYQIKFLGMIPLKSVEVEKIKDLELYPGGVPIGVRVSSEGVLVVGYSDIEINNEKEESPGKVGGLEIGDVILKINGIEMHNSRDLVKAIKQSEKDSIKVDILRHGENITKIVTLKKENNKDYKIGLWIRDSTAGVGTMTFYDDTSKNLEH